jgi:NADH dehydrogenase
MQANVRMPSSVDRALEGSDAVINLVGVLYEQGRQRFSSLHAQGARNIAEAAKARGIKTLIQVSAIGADADSASKYARTKAEGEAAARHSVPTATVVRPSIVFGSEDDFFNRFGALAAGTPALPLPGGGQTRFQPVFVNDVAAAIAACVTDPATRGQTYELGGPATFSFKELMQLVLNQTQRRRLLVPLPWPLARLIGVGGDLAAAVLPIAPPLTSDQVELLTQDNVVSGKLPGLADLGVTPTAVEVVVPTYLYRYRKGGQFAGDMPLVSAG